MLQSLKYSDIAYTDLGHPYLVILCTIIPEDLSYIHGSIIEEKWSEERMISI